MTGRGRERQGEGEKERGGKEREEREEGREVREGRRERVRTSRHTVAGACAGNVERWGEQIFKAF